MSGHSKWANIKRKKEKTDFTKGKIFTKLSRLLTVAAREGGGDPNVNARLKDVIAKAREANLPNENIQRAIQKGTGELEGVSYEEIIYEGYGPGGAAIMAELLTDNRNRTAGEMRHIFDKHGGSLGSTGCVAWMFDKKGLIIIEREANIDIDELMLTALEAGAEDVAEYDDSVEILTTPVEFNEVKNKLEVSGYVLSSAEVTMIPQNTVELKDNDIKKMTKLLDALEENDDVQHVYHNADNLEGDGE